MPVSGPIAVIDQYDAVTTLLKAQLDPAYMKVYAVSEFPDTADALSSNLPALVPLMQASTTVNVHILTARHGRWSVDTDFDFTYVQAQLALSGTASIFAAIQQAMNDVGNAIAAISDTLATQSGVRLDTMNMQFVGPRPIPYLNRAAYWGFILKLKGR